MGQVRDFLMPDLGEGLESGEIVAWNVEVGDHIELNQEICEVETAKAVVAVPSPFAGTLVERFGDVGEELEVGSPLARIDVEEVASGADLPDEVAAQVEGDVEEPAEATSEAGPEADPEQAAAEGGEGGGSKRRSVLVGYGAEEGPGKRRRRGRGKSLGTGTGSAGGNGQAAPAASGGAGAGTKPLAKPPVRKLAKDLGVDLAAIAPGTGPDGIVTREDVRAAAEGGAPAGAQRGEPVGAGYGGEAAAAGAPPATTVSWTGTGFRGRSPGDVIPITGVRKRIVAKMTQSRTEIPEATCSVWADVTDLWDLAAELTQQASDEGHQVKITPFALVCRAAVIALRRFPTMNARIDLDAGEIRLLEHINLGFAADTPHGLIVPNVKDAHTLSTLGLAAEITRLAVAAREGKAKPDELTGGTFTLSNYGFFGNDDGNPIINHPEAGILGVGAMKERPWVVDGELAVRRVAKFTCVFDHRISDGGEAGRFITYIGDLCSDPRRILLHA